MFSENNVKAYHTFMINYSSTSWLQPLSELQFDQHDFEKDNNSMLSSIP